jgi:hypothetical protein
MHAECMKEIKSYNASLKNPELKKPLQISIEMEG